jgi:hypothetical protein
LAPARRFSIFYLFTLFSVLRIDYGGGSFSPAWSSHRADVSVNAELTSSVVHSAYSIVNFSEV